MKRYHLFIPFVLVISLLGAAMLPTPVHAQEEILPEATQEPLTEETEIEDEGMTEEPVTETTQEPQADETEAELVEESTIDLADLTNAVVETAAVLNTGDPSGILGMAYCGASAGAPFQFFPTTGSPANGTCAFDGTTVTAYWTNPIQNAIDYAATGSTVVVEAGNYTESLKITKSLTLQGVGNPVIHSPADIPDTNKFMTGTNSNYPVILVTKGADEVVVNIDGFVVDGDGLGNANYRFIGIAYVNASGTISNNSVIEIRDTPFSGSQHGVGIYVNNMDGVDRTVNIENNIVTDFQKNGMTVTGSGLTANITGNTVTGAGPTSVTAQNGIQISDGAGGSILNNSVSGIWYTGPNWGATAILGVGDLAPVTICQNIVDSSQSGIALAYTGYAIICDNLITNSDWGVSLYPTSTAPQGLDQGEVTGNTIQGSYVGLYVDNPAIPVHNNNFIGNDYGLYFDDWFSTGGILDATNNYWGCATGANTPGCDTALDGVSGYDAEFILLDPFLTEPYSPPVEPEPEPAPAGPVIVPTEELMAGGMQALSCVALNKIVLPSSDYVQFYAILCGYEAQLVQTDRSALPGSVDIGTFDSAVTLSVQENGTALKLLPLGATAKIAFEVPEDSEESYAILYWNESMNDGQGGWVELSAGEISEWSEGKEVYSGMRAYNNTNKVENIVSIVVNFPGTFVLVTK